MKLFVIILIFYSSNTIAAEKEKWMMLGGIYYDNISDLNIKIGVAHYLAKETKINQASDGESVKKYNFPSFIYTDFTFNSNSNSIGLGWGKLNYATNYRIGVNYIEQKEDTLIGIEGVLTLLFYSFKLGVFNSEIDKTKIMMGIGFGW